MKKLCDVTFEEVVSMENLCAAWKEFIRGKQKKKDVQIFRLHLGDELVALHSDLLAGTYRHGGYQLFRINDPKPRDIHKAMVRDRLLHHAIHRKLYPFFASRFIFDSFSSQNGKGVHLALRRFRTFAATVSRNHTRTCWVLKCDIRKFFVNIDHTILLDLLRTYVADAKLLFLLENIIESFHVHRGKGIPLGNLTSQLFSTIYLDVLDQFVKHHFQIKYYIRYADDFVFLSHDRLELIRCLSEVRSFLRLYLALEVHPRKVCLKTIASGIDFLGWIHFSYHMVPRVKTKIRIQKCVRRNPNNQMIQSYLGLLSHGNAYRMSEELKNLQWLLSER